MIRIFNILIIQFFIIFLNGYAFAEELALSEKISLGEQIYKRSFGRGCGACHDIGSNPQLDTLIQNGELDIESFADATINGIRGMPASIAAIMAVGPVRDAGLTEDEIIDALYTYLKFLNVEEIPDDTSIIPSETDENNVEDENEDFVENVITLNQDFSFTIPVIEHVNVNNVKNLYNVDFVFEANDIKLLFQVKEIKSASETDKNNKIILNQNFSFTIPIMEYVNVNNTQKFYNVEFVFEPDNKRTLFQVFKIGGTETIECTAITCSIIKNALNAIDNDEDGEIIIGYIEDARNALREISSFFAGQSEFNMVAANLKKAFRSSRIGDLFKTREQLIKTLIGLNALCNDSTC